MTRFLFVGLCLMLVACATTRESKYAELRERIAIDHDGQLRDVNLTPLADRWDTPEHKQAFISKACDGLDKQACIKKHSEGFFMALMERYYAADHLRVSSICGADPVDCGIKDWENKAARSHNEGIEQHRTQAIQGLENWYSGNTITEQQRFITEQWLKQRAPASQNHSVVVPQSEMDCTTTTTEGFTNTHCE